MSTTTATGSATMKRETQNEWTERITRAGRAALRTWLLAAQKHGTIYYAITNVSRSGMRRTIVLSTIVVDNDGKPRLVSYWPSIGDEPFADGRDGQYSTALDVVAKDVGFSFKSRSFVANGVGMDMVFATVYYLCQVADLKAPKRFASKGEEPSALGFCDLIRRESMV
jgi:hypothetical protein